MIATRKTHQIVALICLLSMGTALAASDEQAPSASGAGVVAGAGCTASDSHSETVHQRLFRYEIPFRNLSKLPLAALSRQQMEMISGNKEDLFSQYDARLDEGSEEYDQVFVETFRRHFSSLECSSSSNEEALDSIKEKIIREGFDAFLKSVQSTKELLMVRGCLPKKEGDSWVYYAPIATTSGDSRADISGQEREYYSRMNELRDKESPLAFHSFMLAALGVGEPYASDYSIEYAKLINLIGMLNALLALPKLRSDYADAHKLMPERPSDMKRGWIRAFDDQVLGAGRIGTSSALAVTALLHAAAAGGGLKNYRNFDPKAIAGVGLAGAALATKVIEFLHGLFTMGKVRVNARERGAYVQWFENANEDELEQLARTRSGLKARAWLTALLSLAESGAACAMAYNVANRDFADDSKDAKANLAPIVGFVTLLKSIVAMSTRSTFAGALANGVSKGEKMREYDARAHQHEATGRRRRVRRA